MAEVITSPIRLAGAPNITLSMSGRILPDLTLDTTGSPISAFLQNFLHGLDNPIMVRGLPSIPSFAPSAPPEWLLQNLPSLNIPLIFPGPQPKPHVIERVSIEQMRVVRTPSGKMLASGTVLVDIRLPSGMSGVELDVKSVLPDVLVLDGPPDEDEDDEEGDSEYPARAFGRIRPDEFLEAASEQLGGLIMVRAPLHDVPMEVLEGRQSVHEGFHFKSAIQRRCNGWDTGRGECGGGLTGDQGRSGA